MSSGAPIQPEGAVPISGPSGCSPEGLERVARAIDPDAWRRRDEDLQRRREWETDIKVGWGETTFEEWANRSVSNSLALASAAIAALQPTSERERIVAWVRSKKNYAFDTADIIADMIERGDHLRESGDVG